MILQRDCRIKRQSLLLWEQARRPEHAWGFTRRVLQEEWRRKFVRKDRQGGLAKKVCQEEPSGRFGIKSLPGGYIRETWRIPD